MSEPSTETVQNPEADQDAERPPRRVRLLSFVPWIVVGVVFVIVLVPIIAPIVRPLPPLPPGRYPGVSVRFPDAPMSVSSQFVFTGGVPGDRYYAAYATAGTVFEVSGKVVGIGAFGDTIERSRPMHVSARADRLGEISLIDVSP
jgi:hypothetical protein